MRLLVTDCEPDQVQIALNKIEAPGASVLLNPQWISPDPDEKLWIACGKPALDMIQKAGWIPKKGGVASNRGKLFEAQPEGWSSPIMVGVTYAPQIYHIEYSDFVDFQTDIALYRRYEETGTIQPKLGHYGYANDLSGVIHYLKAEHARTGLPVDLALDTETEGLDPFNPEKNLVCIQATAKPGISDVVYVLDDHLDPATNSTSHGLVYGGWYMTQRLSLIVSQLEWIAEQDWIKVVGANFKYDMLWLRVKWGIVFKNFTFDTCNGGSLCEENRANTLNLHTKVYSPDLGGYDDHFNQTHDKSKMGEVPKEDLLPYAGGDTDACLRNYHEIRKHLLSDNLTPTGKPSKNSLTSVYINVVHPALKALHKMEYTGVYVDVEKFHEFGSDLDQRINESMALAGSILPKTLVEKYGGYGPNGEVPLSKPKMIADFLFTPMGLNLKPIQVTEKTQAPSTSEYHLTQFKDHPEAAPLIERYLDYKSVAKMHGTYYKGFLNHLRADNKWHPSYIIHKQGSGKYNEQDAAGTVTGRGSATSPAFQCVTGDAEVMTSTGIRLARNLIDPYIPDNAYNPFKEKTYSLWGSKGFQDTSNIFKSWRTDLLKIRFNNGNELKCTPEHPIMTRTGWVKAKEIGPHHYLPMPERVERPPAPEWATEAILEALGLITGAGSMRMLGTTIYLSLPADLADEVKTVIEDMAVPVYRTIDDSDTTLAHLSFELPATTPNFTLCGFIASLPHPRVGIAPNLRGTQGMYPFIRGFLRACGRIRNTPEGSSPGVSYMQAEMTSRKIALDILRETALEGVTPPKLFTRDETYVLEWRGISAGALGKRCEIHELADWPSEASETTKYKYVDSLRVKSVESIGADWVYDFTVPTTHDFIANGMLVHNTVPKHSYWGKRLRECIVAPPGHVIVARDYSQGELKVAACWAGEQKMIEAYLNGIDLHTLTAATVNSMSYEEAMYLKKQDEDQYKALRQNGKAGNFGLLYGMSAYGFMMYADAVYGVKLTLEEAEAMRDAYFDLYPGLPMWHERQISEAYTTGHVRSPLGRVRHLPTINSPIKKIRAQTHNQAINSPIQATLVDMMWMSMGIIEEERPELLIPWGQVHDQGLWYAPEDKVDEALAYSGEIMENLPFEQKFGWKPELIFDTDAEIGFNLAGLEEVK